MKKLMNYFLSVTVLFSILSFVGCDDDDWARYDKKSYNISQVITGNVFVPSEIENELLDIAVRYIDNPTFVYAEYQFNKNDNGMALFRLYGGVSKDGYSVTYLDISVDLRDNTAYEAVYEYGHSKRVCKETEPIIYKDKNAYDVYQSCIKADEVKAESADHIVVKYYCGTVMVVLNDKNNDFIDSLEFYSQYPKTRQRRHNLIP